MAIYGLAEAECWDEDIWKMLYEKMTEHDFSYEIVKQVSWDATKFRTHHGREHFG